MFRSKDHEIDAALDQHWAASDANELETEHRIYHDDAVLEYPQSGERTRGRSNIQNQRASQPSQKRFTSDESLAAVTLDHRIRRGVRRQAVPHPPPLVYPKARIRLRLGYADVSSAVRPGMALFIHQLPGRAHPQGSACFNS